jgi:hypothetical protein
MPRYRIFTNDRRSENGVPKYSCLTEVRAKDEAAAVAKAPSYLGPPHWGVEGVLAPIKAILWPASGVDVEWLKRHV